MSQIEATVDLTAVLRTYLDAWNAPDTEQRNALLERSVSADVEFIDPMKQLAGREALAVHIADVRETFPDVTFEPAGEPDHHNSVLRQAWIARRGDEVVLRGLDVDEVSSDGRLTQIIGFFDRASE